MRALSPGPAINLLTLRQSLQLPHGPTDASSDLCGSSSELGTRAPFLESIGRTVCVSSLRIAKEGLPLRANLGRGVFLLRLGEDGTELGGSILDGGGGHLEGDRVVEKTRRCG